MIADAANVRPATDPASVPDMRSTREAFHRRAEELADWAWHRRLNRADVWGGYTSDAYRAEGGGKSITCPTEEADRKPGALRRARLVQHFRATCNQHVIGLHSIAPNNTSRYFLIDIDHHGVPDDEKLRRNERYAVVLHSRLAAMGFNVLLNDSNAAGGFHLSGDFAVPVPTAQLFEWLQTVVADHAKYNVDLPEVFPKQPRISTETTGPGRWGNWPRLIGRHHSRDHWPAVWNGEEWVFGDAAVGVILETPPNSPALLPPLPEPVIEEKPTEPVKPKVTAAATAWNGSRMTEEEIARNCISHLSVSRRDDYKQWIEVGQAAKSVADSLLSEWDAWSSGSPKYKAGECAAKWATFAGAGAGGKRVTIASLIEWAREDGYEPFPQPGASYARPIAGAPDDGSPSVDDLRRERVARLNTDVGNGERFARNHGKDFRYCHPRGQWLHWTGKRWEWDERGRAVAAAKDTALSIYYEAQAETKLAAEAQARGDEATAAKHGERAAELSKWAVTSQKRERVLAMLAMAQPDLAIMPDDLDADPMLLNVVNGTVDLRSGQLREHRRTDYITKVCRAAYRPDAPHPTLTAFLARTFRSKPSLVDYVQAVMGYCATGQTSEQALFFLYGRGSNGKTTLIDAAMNALGDYAGKADPDLLMARDGSAGHPCNVADLMGRRMVVCSETNDGKRFDEARLKDLVGETRLKARFMRQDFFQFTATHKVLMYSNHRPVVRGTDHGFWRRMKLIPFVETIGDDEKDTTLPAKLAAEADGILAWIVAGAVRWVRDGLATPTAVAEATKAYRVEMDSIGLFIADCCIEGEKFYASARDLYASYGRWCQESGEHPLSQKRLSTTLGERGLHSRRCSTTGRMEWHGIGLKVTSEPPN